MNSAPSLKIHEWLAIAMLMGILGSIAIITSFSQDKTELQVELLEKIHKEGFDVLVKGAVKSPGIYHFHTQIKMRELLALAGTLPESDLRRYRLDSFVNKGRVIHVPTRAMLTVYIKGAVKNEGLVHVPKGTKLQDLLSIVELTEDADVAFLQKKRSLLPDEIIEIPSEPFPL